MTLKFDGWPRKIIGYLFYTTSSFVHHFKSICEFKLKLQSGNASIHVKIGNFFVPCDLEIWSKTFKNNRAPLLHYIKLCESFQSHGWIQTGVTVRKPSMRDKIGNFLSRVTLKFDGWPWKTIGHLFYTTSSFVHHFKTMGELKLELQSGNAQFGSKSVIFCPVWPWNLMDDLEKQKGTSSILHQFCATFCSHWWIQNGVTVWKRLIWVKIDDFFSRVTLNFDGWPWKTIGHLF